ncbi:MAG: DUF1614 domain-containing protein [Sulfolobaceae archaeon]
MFLLPFRRILLPIYILLGFLLAIISIDYFKNVFENAGYPHELSIILSVLLPFLSLLTSPINIIIKKIPRKDILEQVDVIYFFGIPFYFPRIKIVDDFTIIAINIGGAIVPLLVSFLLLSTFKEFNLLKILVIIILSTIFSNKTSKVIAGLGVIANPYLSPILNGTLSFILFQQQLSLIPISTYIATVIGAIVGADLLNLKKIIETRPQLISIGGLGTFDGIYVSGLIGMFFGELIIYLNHLLL